MLSSVWNVDDRHVQHDTRRTSTYDNTPTTKLELILNFKCGSGSEKKGVETYDHCKWETESGGMWPL